MSKFGGILLVLGALALAAPAAAEAQGFVVIVNSGNATTTLSKSAVSKLFLKQTKSWPAGGTVQPVDQDRAAAPRAAFSTAVHGRSVASVEEFWLQQVFAGKDEPPATQKDDAAVIAYVSSTPGAVGYVSASATLPGGVKKMTVTP